MANEKAIDKTPTATAAGRGITHRQATPEELKKHKEDMPKVLAGIKATHRKTMERVKKIMGGIMFVDRG